MNNKRNIPRKGWYKKKLKNKKKITLILTNYLWEAAGSLTCVRLLREPLKVLHHIDQSRPAASNRQSDTFSRTRAITKNILQVFCSRWKCNLDKCKLSSWRCFDCYLDVFFLFESVISCSMSFPLITLACSAPLEEIGGKSLIAKIDKACSFPC